MPAPRRKKTAPPVLEVRSLCIHRGGTEILKDLSWSVHPGEHWVILGPNGCGKTSLLSALTGYFTPSDGSLSLLGQDFGESDWRLLRTRVGLVSSRIRQMMPDAEPALTSVLSGKYAMLEFWGDPTAADTRAALRILRQLKLEHLAQRPWRVLSQGERQRILIGRALMARPRILILDEPCAGLDPVAREGFLHFLQELGTRKDAPTLVLVTHHVEEITPAFTHALLLQAGRAIAAGPIGRVLSSRHLSTAFECPVQLHRRNARYTLQIRGSIAKTP